MKTIGIIAEYNPFHRGHAYQIETVRKMTGADCIVVAMSGNFVQRGTPAWTDKYLRTQMALEGGADIVFELPAVYATASAENFALGGVSLLHQLGFVDALCFGCECDDLSVLSPIADYLSVPDSDYQTEISANLRTGSSYPAAREKVLTTHFPELLQKYPSLLSSPNTILGIEYLKALKKLNSRMTPIPILRTDGGYHETDPWGGFLSASGIREFFASAVAKEYPTSENSSLPRALPQKFVQNALASLGECIPNHVQRILVENTSRFPITENDFSSMIYYRLRTSAEEELLSISDMTPDLYHRIQSALSSYTDVSDFITCIKTKAFTHSRIRRVLLHVLLDIKSESIGTPTLYANLLGIRKSASGHLRNVKEIPVITKPADAERQISTFRQTHTADANRQAGITEQGHTAGADGKNRENTLSANHLQSDPVSMAQRHRQTDILADDLYRKIVWEKYRTPLPDTFHAPLIILQE